MDNRKEHRKANGKRFSERGLAAVIAQDIVGLLLAQAYVVTKSSGFQINVNKLDGVPHTAHLSDLVQTINVDVVNSIVQRSWAS